MTTKKKIWILGGAFDPPHLGHLELVRDLLNSNDNAEIWIVPTGIGRGKTMIAPAEARMRMCELTFFGNPRVKILPLEIDRAVKTKLPSNTFDTLKELKKKHGASRAFSMVVGLDQWKNIHNWYRYPAILEMANWIVVERKGVPGEARSTEELIIPTYFKTNAKKISSSQIRNTAAKEGLSAIEHYLTQEVYKYLSATGLYVTKDKDMKNLSTPSKNISVQPTYGKAGSTPKEVPPEIMVAAKSIFHKSGERIRVLDLRGLSSFTDFYLLASGFSDRQVQSAANHVVDTLRALGKKPLSIEGMELGRWVLLDYGSFVIHIFLDAVREYYDIDGLWARATIVPFPPDLFTPFATQESKSKDSVEYAN